jgi:hypothetical protein
MSPNSTVSLASGALLLALCATAAHAQDSPQASNQERAAHAYGVGMQSALLSLRLQREALHAAHVGGDDAAAPHSAALRIRPRNHELIQGATLLTGGLVSFGVILLLPDDVSKWRRDEGFAPGWSNFRRAFTQPPVWDEDEWLVNLVGHPLIGMHTYLLERNFDASPLQAFLFSTAASVGWEYLIESWAEQPSIQDLLFTSTIGSVLGELNHQATRRLRRGGLRGWEKVVLTIINPHDVLYHGYR